MSKDTSTSSDNGTKKRTSPDLEMSIIGSIVRKLEALEPDARARVLAYVTARFNEPPIEQPPLLAPKTIMQPARDGGA